ncbi:MAG: hypothetical protein HY344_03830 [Candidatus Levybacteria bacterium]|nr:hypothetical protein [Candidatus Levybacteria bacterium]
MAGLKERTVEALRRIRPQVIEVGSVESFEATVRRGAADCVYVQPLAVLTPILDSAPPMLKHIVRCTGTALTGGKLVYDRPTGMSPEEEAVVERAKSYMTAEKLTNELNARGITAYMLDWQGEIVPPAQYAEDHL